MKGSKLLIGISFLALLSGCAAQGGTYQTPHQNYQRVLSETRSAAIDKVAAGAVLTSIFFEGNGEEKTIERAKDVAASSLIDPDSAQFRNTRLVDFKDGKVLCGEINAKNRMGGYTGYRPFVSSVANSTIYSKESNDDITRAVNAGITRACM